MGGGENTGKGRSECVCVCVGGVLNREDTAWSPNTGEGGRRRGRGEHR